MQKFDIKYNAQENGKIIINGFNESCLRLTTNTDPSEIDFCDHNFVNLIKFIKPEYAGEAESIRESTSKSDIIHNIETNMRSIKKLNIQSFFPDSENLANDIFSFNSDFKNNVLNDAADFAYWESSSRYLIREDKYCINDLFYHIDNIISENLIKYKEKEKQANTISFDFEGGLINTPNQIRIEKSELSALSFIIKPDHARFEQRFSLSVLAFRYM